MVEGRIFLTGFMGCGKSTVGAIVAPALGWAFTDLDTEIIAQAGRGIAAIFVEEGEAAFRDRESDALRACPVRTVCAVGGGALAEGTNLQWALQHGFVAYLHVEVCALARRLGQSRVRRPLLEDAAGQPLTGGQLEARIRTTMGRRSRYYEQAHTIVRATQFSAAEAARAVVMAYRNRNVCR